MRPHTLLWLALSALTAPVVSAQTPLAVEVAASGLAGPLAIAHAPGDYGRLFVVERPGSIRVLKSGGPLPTPFLDISSIVESLQGERGLLGLAFHPDFATNGWFFVNYTRQPDGATVVARYKVSAGNPDVADPASALTIITIPQPFDNHNGGDLKFGPDGFLYIGLGDGGLGGDPFENGQNLAQLLGKFLRIDVNASTVAAPYAVPTTNPFLSTPGARPEIWSLGWRNPWRYSFDRLTGDLWVGDVGQEHREEVDLEAPGAGGLNYGWRCIEGDLCTNYSGSTCTCPNPAFTPPIYVYPHDSSECCIIGGCVYRGAAIPDLRGAYFYSDFCSQRIFSIRWNGTSVFGKKEHTAELAPPPPLVSALIASFGEDAAGELYFCTLLGDVFKIVPQSPVKAGITTYGAGLPGCAGVQSIAASSNPVLSNPIFELLCDHAPANALGLALLGDAKLDPFVDSLFLGLPLAIDVFGTSFLQGLDFVSDAAGDGRAALPIPNAPILVGRTFYAQGIWVWGSGPGAACNSSIFGMSSTDGLEITILP